MGQNRPTAATVVRLSRALSTALHEAYMYILSLMADNDLHFEMINKKLYPREIPNVLSMPSTLDVYVKAEDVISESKSNNLNERLVIE